MAIDPFPTSYSVFPRSTKSGPLGAAILGWRAWNVNNQGVISSRDSRTTNWAQVPSNGVIAVQIFFDMVYVTGEGQTRHYRAMLHSQDYYWANQADGSFASGPAEMVPAGLANNQVKNGGLMSDSAWRTFISARQDEHSWP